MANAPAVVRERLKVIDSDDDLLRRQARAVRRALARVRRGAGTGCGVSEMPSLEKQNRAGQAGLCRFPLRRRAGPSRVRIREASGVAWGSGSDGSVARVGLMGRGYGGD